MPRVKWRNPKIRNSHTWVIAPTNQGKTVLLKTCLAFDLKAVQAGKAVIFIIEGEGQILNAMNSLELFERVPLTVIDPRDTGLALNPFDVPATNRGRDTSVIEMLEFVFNSILDAPLTPKQEPFFSSLIQTMLLIEKPSLAKMLAILEGRHDIYPENLGPRLRYFWEVTFKQDDTRTQLAWRLRKVFERSQAMAKIFSSHENHADYRSLVNEPGVTIVHPNRGLLRKHGTAFFGRLALAQIWNAIETTRDPNDENLQCFIYVDEAHSYVEHDPNVVDMLDQMRKYNAGLVLAHQRVNQLSPNVLDALHQDAGTILAAGVKDAGMLARAMGCSPEDIQHCPQGEFMLYIKGQYDKAIKVHIPGYDLDQYPKRAVPPRPVYKHPHRDPDVDEDGPMGEPPGVSEPSPEPLPSAEAAPSAPPPTPPPDHSDLLRDIRDILKTTQQTVASVPEMVREIVREEVRGEVDRRMADYNLKPAPVVDQNTALTVRTRDAEFKTEPTAERPHKPTRRGTRARNRRSAAELNPKT